MKDSAENEFKTPEGVEFCELVQASGLSAAEVARRMELSEASLSKYLNGKISPPKSRLVALRSIVGKVMMEKTGGRYPEAEEGVAGMEHPEVASDARKLDEIRRADPRKFQSLREVIGTYHGSVKIPASSAAEEIAANAAPSALKLALHPHPKSRREPKAGDTTSYKRRRGRGTGAHSTKRPEPPNPAPK